MIVQFSRRGERLFARKRSWLYAKNGTVGAFGSQSANAGQSGSAWPVSPSARPVPTASRKQRPLRKSVVERFAALTREEREETSKIGDETYPVTCISLISP